MCISFYYIANVKNLQPKFFSTRLGIDRYIEEVLKDNDNYTIMKFDECFEDVSECLSPKERPACCDSDIDSDSD